MVMTQVRTRGGGGCYGDSNTPFGSGKRKKIFFFVVACLSDKFVMYHVYTRIYPYTVYGQMTKKLLSTSIK